MIHIEWDFFGHSALFSGKKCFILFGLVNPRAHNGKTGNSKKTRIFLQSQLAMKPYVWTKALHEETFLWFDAIMFETHRSRTGLGLELLLLEFS